MRGSFKISWDVPRNLDLRAAAEDAARAGFEGLTTSAAALRPGELSQTGRREVRAVLARHSLLGAALRADLPDRGFTPDADADRILSQLQEAMTTARDCGFSVVACDLGRLPRAEHAPPARKRIDPAAVGAILLPEPAQVEPPAPPRPLTPEERQHAALATEVMRELGARADRVGVPIAFSASLAALADLVALLRSAACPLFGRELDPVALLEEGSAGAVAMEPPVLHVRGRDAHRGAEGQRRAAALGEGDGGWPELLEALGDADFRGFVSVQGSAAEARAGLSRLRGGA